MSDNENDLREQLDEMRQKLQKQEKMAQIGMLTAGIAHEVQNPLNFVLNFSKLSQGLLDELNDATGKFAEKIDPDDALDLQEIIKDLKDNMDKIQEHGNRAISVIRGILMQSRGKEGEFLPTDVQQLIHEYVWLSYHAVRANDKGFNVSIHEEYQENMPKMMVVPQDLSRAVLNVMNNACYTVSERSALAEDGYQPSISVKVCHSAEEGLRIDISDNGMGMTDEVKTKLYDNFFTTKPSGKGTGLGMGIIRQIVTEEHKGQILLDTEPGRGTTFTFVIPVKTIK